MINASRLRSYQSGTQSIRHDSLPLVVSPNFYPHASKFQFIPSVNPYGTNTTIIPLVTILLAAAAKEVFEDFVRSFGEIALRVLFTGVNNCVRGMLCMSPEMPFRRAESRYHRAVWVGRRLHATVTDRHFTFYN